MIETAQPRRRKYACGFTVLSRVVRPATPFGNNVAINRLDTVQMVGQRGNLPDARADQRRVLSLVAADFKYQSLDGGSARQQLQPEVVGAPFIDRIQLANPASPRPSQTITEHPTASASSAIRAVANTRS